MDQHANWLHASRIERTKEALIANQYAVSLVSDPKELIEIIENELPEGSTVSVGGSMTLFETGIIDHLRSGRYEFWDRYAGQLSPEDLKALYVRSFSADAYFTSSNAITEDGGLYNVDGNGNRVAAMLYGPKKVFVIAGANKIVKNLDAAIARNREYAAPANTKRLNRKTPCAVTGVCSDCKSPERICNDYVYMQRQTQKDRIHVILLTGSFGY